MSGRKARVEGEQERGDFSRVSMATFIKNVNKSVMCSSSNWGHCTWKQVFIRCLLGESSVRAGFLSKLSSVNSADTRPEDPRLTKATGCTPSPRTSLQYKSSTSFFCLL